MRSVTVNITRARRRRIALSQLRRTAEIVLTVVVLAVGLAGAGGLVILAAAIIGKI